MNRKQAEVALMIIAKKIAERHGCNIVSTRDSTNGLWDSTDFTGWEHSLSELLEHKYGKMKETHFTSVPIEDYDLRKDFKVSLEYRFGNPKICVGTQWGADGFACVEFRAMDSENDADYQMCASQIFKETGIKYHRVIMRGWRDARKEIGEDPFDWKDEEEKGTEK